MSEPVQRLAYSSLEAAQLLGLSRATVYNLMNSGELPSMKLGRSRRIRHEVLVAYLDRCSVAS
jgi:excisionase family DNA binding protein